jgi:hypothetical protein
MSEGMNHDFEVAELRSLERVTLSESLLTSSNETNVTHGMIRLRQSERTYPMQVPMNPATATDWASVMDSNSGLSFWGSNTA